MSGNNMKIMMMMIITIVINAATTCSFHKAGKVKVVREADALFIQFYFLVKQKKKKM